MRISADLDRSCMLYAPKCTHGMHLRRCEASHMAMRIPEAVHECSNISDEPKILNHTSTSHCAIGGLGHPTTSNALAGQLGEWMWKQFAHASRARSRLLALKDAHARSSAFALARPRRPKASPLKRNVAVATRDRFKRPMASLARAARVRR